MKGNSPSDPFARTDALATLGDWLRFAEKLYTRENVALGQVATNAHDEALYLLLRTLKLSLESDASVLTRKLTPVERADVRDVLRRRVVDRVPAAYLTREAWLGEHRFYVDERVIIPRSYFLELIPGALRDWLPDHGRRLKRAVDVCTGSGCLAILLAHEFPRAVVDAIDVSTPALDVAVINVREHRLGQRVHLFQSDVFDEVPAARYDIILSNPPYEPSRHVDRQAPEFAAEPRLAHDGGPDGLMIIRKLLHQAKGRLAPHGIVVIEVGGLRKVIDREFKALEPHWLPTQDGSDCVCLFEAERLRG
ncbi:50S ribosomal protein L3 N(5)-glutamine methyltransferase [Opitutus terrae]|uniref:Protein-(Glutamine-N5) methyltransferase, ribosomal protein L3-specific n=1 Tax=Opitutus terrae (strain DSM 11246 / JCM 15787 / PB90-1) TaxID=452637 RepID=B1ZS36_OPITP|nr:50S ribosomal protein L3 N(5)-glutamine methyltransferase [Opitutus terrae]ACB74712.1 protein-(glutamine-N5) methyltransferase, ribosomal protein L3-specific [Opitutus terrae PB90-1]